MMLKFIRKLPCLGSSSAVCVFCAPIFDWPRFLTFAIIYGSYRMVRVGIFFSGHYHCLCFFPLILLNAENVDGL